MWNEAREELLGRKCCVIKKKPKQQKQAKPQIKK